MLKLQGCSFVDEQGRELLLRGVNLGGSSKVPLRPNGATHLPDSLSQPEKVSFIGRPFPLSAAREHFARLREWGLTFLRFVITWEAVEHAGPGMYDHAYLDYLTQVIQMAGEYDLKVLIDPHQDVWSRWTGGDGAPAWTLELLGMDISALHTASASYLHQEAGDAYGKMVWPANNGRYAAATMWTLFFGGDLFAPATTISGQPIQYLLQGHFFEAMRQVALRLRGMSHVVGFETLNEPASGYIGRCSLHEYASPLLRNGPSPTIWEGMLLASGYPQRIKLARQGIPYLFPRHVLANPEGRSLWQPGYTSVWQANGVWDTDNGAKAHILRNDHFAMANGRPVDFAQDCFHPFVRRYASGIREILPDMPIFVCPVPADHEAIRGIDLLPDDVENLVYAPHWYDGVTLSMQRYLPWLGVDYNRANIRLVLGRQRRLRTIRHTLQNLRTEAQGRNVPLLLGETGIPYNLDEGQAYLSGDYSDQINAWRDILQGVEDARLSTAFWNYTADNDNLHGDQWNGEDLSIYSSDQRSDPDDINSGGRALEGFIRPYVIATAGKLVNMNYQDSNRTLRVTIEHDPTISHLTELYVPSLQYPNGWIARASHGHIAANDSIQHLLWEHDPVKGRQTLTLASR